MRHLSRIPAPLQRPGTHRSGAVLAAAGALAALLLAGCATQAPAPCPACPGEKAAIPASPTAPPLQPARFDDLPGWQDDDLAAAWPGFLNSCKGMKSRRDWPLWRGACEEAATLGTPDSATARRFFESRFTPWRLVNPDGADNGLITGYYEPMLNGSRQRISPNQHPVLPVPADLLTIELSDVFPELKNLRLRGRLQGNKVVPYWSRAELAPREAKMGEKAIAWVDDPIELFFLQIQGSGRVKLPDGTLLRVGYADQNGHPYQSIGRVLIDRGELKPEQASMQGIQGWARANPTKVQALLNENPSYVFFREVKNADGGPIGALGVPLSDARSLAVDPRTTPLGAPVFLATTWPNEERPLNRLMLAQDTGGAIKGVVRADFFWGFGPDAGSLAGRMKQKGRMWVLLPPGVGPR